LRALGGDFDSLKRSVPRLVFSRKSESQFTQRRGGVRDAEESADIAFFEIDAVHKPFGGGDPFAGWLL